MNLQIFGAGVQSRSRVVTAARRLNCYFELEDVGRDRSQVTIYGRPGLTEQVDMGAAATRGMAVVEPYLYAVNRNQVLRIRRDFSMQVLGTIGTDAGDVGFAANPTQLLILDGDSGYVVTLSTGALAEIADADFPAGARTCTYTNGYGVVEKAASAQFYISGADDFTSWDALDFSSADSDPDDLVAVAAYQGILALLGDTSTEFWGYTGNADFPFERVIQSKLDWGLASRASLAAFGNDFIGLCKNDLGELVPCLIGTDAIKPIAPPDLVHAINGYSVTNDAVGAAFLLNRHPMYLLTFPSAGKSWVYDQAASLWYEWQSGATGGRFRGLHAVSFNGATVVTDYANGKLYTLEQGIYADNGDAFATELVSRHLFSDDVRQVLHRLELDVEAGNGPITSLAYRENLFTYSEQFDNAAWAEIGSSISADATTAPDGATTMDKMVEDGTTSQRYAGQNVTGLADNILCWASCYFYAGERTWAKIIIEAKDGTYEHNWYDLSTGVVSSSSQSTYVGIEDLGGGFYRCYAARNIGSGVTAPQVLFGMSDADGGLAYAGDGSSGLYLWGAQLTTGSAVEPYTPTTDTALTLQRVTVSGGEPQWMLQVSRDKGRSYGNEHWASSGAIGKYRQRLVWRRLGSARDFVLKVRITDPVYRVLTGESLRLEKRAA